MRLREFLTMNDFEPKSIKKASHYLQEKLDLFKKGGAVEAKDNVYVIEAKKDSMFKRIVGSIFK